MVARIADYIELGKPGITLFIAISTAAGYILAPGPVVFVMLVHTVLGTALAAAGAATLNEYVERAIDPLMRRTASRPLPSLRVTPRSAFIAGYILAIIGIIELIVFVNASTALLAALAFVSYVYIYTPLKRVTPWCTLVGTIPGALPILAGWTARGSIADTGGWVLFFIMVCWQLPHFYALAWLYRGEYRDVGLRMLTTTDATGDQTRHVVVLSTVALIVATAAPLMIGMAGPLYLIGAMIMNVQLLRLGLQMKGAAIDSGARRLFGMSLIYLPVVLGLLILDAVTISASIR